MRQKKLKAYIVKVIDDTARACGRNLSEKQKLTILNKAKIKRKDLK